MRNFFGIDFSHFILQISKNKRLLIPSLTFTITTGKQEENLFSNKKEIRSMQKFLLNYYPKIWL